MKKYICSICGYVYDEASGDPERGIAPGTRWEDLPPDWACPLCGAAKADFNEDQPAAKPVFTEEWDVAGDLRELTAGELSALCSNLSKGCEKQYRAEEADLFRQLAEYFKGKTKPPETGGVETLLSLVEQDLNSGYAKAFGTATAHADRGALRALTWGEKVSKLLNSLLARYETLGDSLLENTNVFVCEICGFIYVGEDAPDVCPVCKVPKFKVAQVRRGE